MGKIADRLRAQYTAKSGSSPATREDIDRAKRELSSDLRKLDPERGSGRQMAGRAVRMARRGFADINKSLATPHDETARPKIAQMPGSRKEFKIAKGASLEGLKMPGLQGQTILGRKIRNKKNKFRGFVL